MKTSSSRAVVPVSRRLAMGELAKNRVKSSEGKTKKKKGSLVLPKKVKVQIEADFGKHAPRLIEMLEMDRTDGALTLLKKKLLQTSVGLLPHAERTVRESQSARGVYQFSTLVSQIREIMSDIEADRDRDLLMKVLDDQVIKPSFMDAAQQVVIRHHEFRKAIERHVRDESVQDVNIALKKLAQALARDMQEEYKRVMDGLSKALKN